MTSSRAAAAVVWLRSGPSADIEQASSGGHDPDAPAELGSVTKTVTATLLGRLSDLEVVHVDDPVERWLPSCPPGTGITLRLLAEHRSGLRSLPPGVFRYSRDPYRRFTENALRQQLPRLDRHLTCAPGTNETYSNFGYAVLGAALAKAAGAPWYEAVMRHVLQPALTQPFTLPPAWAGPSSPTTGPLRRRPWDMSGAILPAGGLWGTARGILQYAQAMLADDPVGGAQQRWWRSSGELRWHNGATRDASVFVGHLPRQRRTVVVHAVGQPADVTDALALQLLSQ